jgi:hypothetical protein
MNGQPISPPTARRNSDEVIHQSSSSQNDWLRVPAACALAGLSRSTLYAAFDISGGAIRTASVKRRGAIRGIRMISQSSLLAWLDSFAEGNTNA